ncbi:MAG TPA: hypothetical protein DDZ92_03870 [Halomonas sp.]|nr:hypothetical protein [Halomonas sp.]
MKDDAQPLEDDVMGPEAEWLMRARRAYDAGTTYIEGEVRAEWERDIAHFQNRHAPGSKYHSKMYAKRSKTFRPKVRMNGRAWEAGVASALFSTSDLIDVKPHRHNDPSSVAGAALIKALLQYRLEISIPWFQTAIGAAQDCYVHGICASYQDWDFHEKTEQVSMMGPEGAPITNFMTGEPLSTEVRTRLRDKPIIEMIPPENLRFDPGCDWRDPVGTSAYLVRVVPMHIDEAEERMLNGEWRPLSREVLRSSSQAEDDAVRRQREHGRPEHEDEYTDNPIVYCHQNFIRHEGQEWVYWTLQADHLLSDPVPLEKMTPLGERPIVIGKAVIEAHRPYPRSQSALVAPLQEMSNDVANQRMDNVQLVLNKRYVLRRGRQIDVESLQRNVPGGGIMTDNPAEDIRVLETPDVTGSSYSEQDRLDVQIDEMTGNFSQSAVQTNRVLNETVGGMNLMAGGASAISEYSVRIFVETWVEPVMRQLVKLEQAFEDDATVLAIAGETAQLERFGVDQNTDDLLRTQIRLRVNVGVGSTNPEAKIQRLMTGMQAVANMPGVAERIKADQVITEVFGALGYEDGARFFLSDEEIQQRAESAPPPPEVQAAQAEQQAMQAKMQADQQMAQMRMQADQQLAQIKAQSAMQIEQIRAQNEQQLAQIREQIKAQNEQEVVAAEMALKREMFYAEMALKQNLTMAQLEAKLQIDREKSESQRLIESAKLQTTRDVTALVEGNRTREMQLRRETGAGI